MSVKACFGNVNFPRSNLLLKLFRYVLYLTLTPKELGTESLPLCPPSPSRSVRLYMRAMCLDTRIEAPTDTAVQVFAATALYFIN